MSHGRPGTSRCSEAQRKARRQRERKLRRARRRAEQQASQPQDAQQANCDQTPWQDQDQDQDQGQGLGRQRQAQSQDPTPSAAQSNRHHRRHHRRTWARILGDEQSNLPALNRLEQTCEELDRRHHHGNRRLQMSTLVVLLVVCFIEGTVRSLRAIEAFSYTTKFRQFVGDQHVPRSTLSDAMKVCDPQPLGELLKSLRGHLGNRQLDQFDPDLRCVLKRATYLDGTFFRVARDVQWAISQRVGGPNSDHKIATVRIDMRLGAGDELPQGLALAGKDDGGEAVAIYYDVQPGEIRVGDRGTGSHKTFQEVTRRQADFLIRVQRSLKCVEQQDRPLSQKDVEHGVTSDQIVTLEGRKSCDKTTRYRLITITPEPAQGPEHPDRQRDEQPIRVLSSLTDDTPAWVLAELYRRRWQIELFFRWLKVCARWDHLLSHQANGVQVQMYVGLIASVLLALRFGDKPDKFALLVMGWVMNGEMTLKDAMEILKRRWAERDRDRQRRRRAKNQG